MKLVILLLVTSFMMCSGEVFKVSRVLSKQTKNSVEMTVKKGDAEEKIFVEHQSIISSKDVVMAYADRREGGGLLLALNKSGGSKMFQATKKMKHGVDRVAIIIDGKVTNTMVIQHNIGPSFEVKGLEDISLKDRQSMAMKIKTPEK